MEWLATFRAFSRDRAIPNADGAVLVQRTGAVGQLRHQLTAISDFTVWPELAGRSQSTSTLLLPVKEVQQTQGARSTKPARDPKRKSTNSQIHHSVHQERTFEECLQGIAGSVLRTQTGQTLECVRLAKGEQPPLPESA
jgi:hypothetical protein